MKKKLIKRLKRDVKATTFKVRAGTAMIVRSLDPYASQAFSRSLLVMHAHYYPNPKIEGNDVEVIRQNLQWLKENCNVVPLSEGLRCLERGMTLPKRAVSMVVDDATAGFADQGLPLLAEAGIPYSLAVIPGFVDSGTRDYKMARLMHMGGHHFRAKGRTVLKKAKEWFRLKDEKEEGVDLNTLFVRARELSDASLSELLNLLQVPHHNMMNWKQLRRLTGTGQVELVSHTMSHPHLRHANEDWLEWETLGAKRALEGATGEPVDVFVYPYGHRKDANRKVVNALQRAGYEYGLLTRKGITTGKTCRFRIPRVNAEVPETVFRKHASTAGWAILYGSRPADENPIECRSRGRGAEHSNGVNQP